MNLNLAHQTQLYLGLFERETYPWLSRFSQGVATAVDIGAAQGEYTIYFLKTTTAKVYAFEPDPLMRDRMNSNLKLNPELVTERLTLSQEFVGRANGPGCVCL